MLPDPKDVRDFNPDVTRYQTLLGMADLLAQSRTLPELFPSLVQRLGDIVKFEFLNICLHHPARGAMRGQLWDRSGALAIPIELPVGEAASGWVWENQKHLVFDDIATQTGFPRTLDLLRQKGARSLCIFPLSTPQSRMGAISFSSRHVSAYGIRDLQFLPRVAEMVAHVVEVARTHSELQLERKKVQSLLEVNSMMSQHPDLQAIMPAVSSGIRRISHHEYASIDMREAGTESMRMFPLDFPLARQVVREGLAAPLEQFPGGRALLDGRPLVFNRVDLESMKSTVSARMLAEGIQSIYSIPLVTPEGAIGALSVGTTRKEDFEPQDMDLLKQLAVPLAMALENARAYREIADLKDKLAHEKLYLEDEIRTELNFEDIVGDSFPLKRTIEQVKTVAPSEATVLILGETGTGKELIARAIHNLSTRRDQSFIKLNCAAIPTGLLESELFGHEKGAFTGAIMQKRGRLEVADHGTLFLDEVGDIPLELQPKLLRVLQDQEFERLGSTRTIRVNVRIIAATNRDLARAVSERAFRSDLFYRLNVFPITIAPLRDRRKDIPTLVRYFVQRIARRMNKPIDTIPAETMAALTSWDWPGNIRELENFIERSVILTSGHVLKAPLAELKPAYEGTPRRDNTLETAEKEHILRILRECSGTISGPRGAASRLGLKRTTLQSKMQKLGINRQDYLN